MKLEDDTNIRIIESGGMMGRTEVAGEIRFGDLPPEARLAAQSLVDALAAGKTTQTLNVGSMGFGIVINGTMFHNVPKFTKNTREADDLKTLVMTRGKILPKNGASPRSEPQR